VPQVVLLDLNLPRKSGLEVLREIKADPRTQDIPVVVLTVSTRDRDIAECRRLGVETYIIKPVGFQKFSEVTPNLDLAWTLVKPPRTEMAKSARIAGRKTSRPKSNESDESARF
jgi:CheY-like chemotaxis protein